MVAAAYIEGDHGLPMDTAMIAAKLQFFVASLKARLKYKKITLKYAANYCRIVVKQVNVSKEYHDNKVNNIRTGLIKV